MGKGKIKEKGCGIIKEFKEFALKGNVIDLAVGVIIGGAFQTIVKSLIDDVIMPFVGSLFSVNFDDFTITVRNSVISYGKFISAVINFFIMALIIFLFVKSINKLRSIGAKKEEAIEAATTKKCPYCCSEIDVNAVVCPHCTSKLDK